MFIYIYTYYMHPSHLVANVIYVIHMNSSCIFLMHLWLIWLFRQVLIRIHPSHPLLHESFQLCFFVCGENVVGSHFGARLSDPGHHTSLLIAPPKYIQTKQCVVLFKSRVPTQGFLFFFKQKRITNFGSCFLLNHSRHFLGESINLDCQIG